jgi:hypothetical protein
MNDQKYFAMRERSPVEMMFLGTLPNPSLAEEIGKIWNKSASVISEETARAIIAGDLIPEGPMHLRPYIAQDLSVLLGDMPTAQQWARTIKFLTAPARQRKR